MMWGTTSTGKRFIMAAAIATEPGRFVTVTFSIVPSAFWRYSTSSRWNVMLMKGGANSIKGSMELYSLLMSLPFNGGTSSKEAKGLFFCANISVTFIVLFFAMASLFFPACDFRQVGGCLCVILFCVQALPVVSVSFLFGFGFISHFQKSGYLRAFFLLFHRFPVWHNSLSIGLCRFC